MTQSIVDNVNQTVTVGADLDRAFSVFVEQIYSWWPPAFRITEPGTTLSAEARPGGRWYEIGPDGTEHTFGRLLAYEPPTRLVVAWHLNAHGEVDPDPAHASEIEVRFIAETTDRTRVEIEHSRFDRLGSQAKVVRNGMEQGWPTILKGYVTEVEAAA